MAQHRNKHAFLQAVTANRLSDGEVVYFTKPGAWSELLHEAEQVRGKEESEALLAKAERAGAEVIEPYLFELQEGSGALVAASVRERIRSTGPTTHLDLGKQARMK